MTTDIKAWIKERRTARKHGDRVDQIAGAQRNLPRALNALNAVLRVHRPDEFWDSPGEYFCNECQRAQMNGVWPCPTVQAIEGAINHE